MLPDVALDDAGALNALFARGDMGSRSATTRYASHATGRR
ncbi:hypothetical protein SALB1_3549 [Salinisphaera sp. LB1]|nr:hypothetical protein SALB1_3549 [Salinisphaera sp. LB1]